ncbi:MAG: hypothetical protein R2850_01375 [Bacteroidia bacterium]
MKALPCKLRLFSGMMLVNQSARLHRYRRYLRIPAYRRVDMGVTKHFISADRRPKEGSFLSKLETLSLSLEIFNLLGINNTVYTFGLKMLY